MKALVLGIAASVLVAGVAHADGDAAAGEAVFKKCVACHSVGEGAKNKVGPVLNDVLGRVAGTMEGFKYSKALIDAGAGGLVWTPETVAQWMHKPKDMVKGTKMTFAGLADEADIQNLIAYLMTFSPDYTPAAQ